MWVAKGEELDFKGCGLLYLEMVKAGEILGLIHDDGGELGKGAVFGKSGKPNLVGEVNCPLEGLLDGKFKGSCDKVCGDVGLGKFFQRVELFNRGFVHEGGEIFALGLGDEASYFARGNDSQEGRVLFWGDFELGLVKEGGENGGGFFRGERKSFPREGAPSTVTKAVKGEALDVRRKARGEFFFYSGVEGDGESGKTLGEFFCEERDRGCFGRARESGDD